MTHSTSVLVLGYGEMGHAMERLLAERTQLVIWEKFPKTGFLSVSLPEAAPRAEVVIFCLPTRPHAQVLEELVPLLRPCCICLSVAKGLDEAGLPATRILEAALVERFGYGVLCGPMIAEEIQTGRHACAQLGARGAQVVERVMALFAGTRLHLTPCADMLGINWAVILKNVYALAFGMADELGLGDNVRGCLAVIATREMDLIVRRMGGAPGTAQGLAGLGDLITTATSGHSHHHELGRRFARSEAAAGPAGSTDGEAIHTLRIIGRHGLLNATDLPLWRLIAGIVTDPADVRRRFEEFLSGVG